MASFRPIIAATLALCCAASSAQVRAPVRGSVVAKSAISTAQVEQLSRAIAERPAATTLNIDPNKVTAAAGTQAPPVEVAGSRVVPTGAATPPPANRAPAQFEVIKTSPAEEKLLTSAIAANDQLKTALSNPSSSIIPLPGIVRMSEQGGPPLQLKPFIFVNQPLEHDPTGYFKGQLLVGVTEIADTGATKELPTPLLFQIIGAARSEPDKVLVNSTSPPFRPVDVWLKAVPGGVAKLLVVSVIDHAGTPVALPIETELNIDTGSGNIAGFGIETTNVTVSATNAADAAGRTVMLHVAPSGYLDKNKLVLDAKGTADAVLRSGSVGSAHLTATSPGLAAVTADVHYTFPFIAIAASILGGLLGAAVSLFTAPGDKATAMTRFAASAGLGVIVFVAYVIGINLLPFHAEVAVGALSTFALSALGAWLGPSVVNWRNAH